MELDARPSSRKAAVVTGPGARGCCWSCGTRPPAPSDSKGAWGGDAVGIRPASLRLPVAAPGGWASCTSTGTPGPRRGGEMPDAATRGSQLRREVVSSPAAHGTGGRVYPLSPAGKRKRATQRWVKRCAQAAQLLRRKFIRGLGFPLLPRLMESAWCNACRELLSASPLSLR